MDAKKRVTLREYIPTLEVEWLMPSMLLLIICVSAIAETWTIGVAVERIYSIRTGWAIGGVVAVSQAIGSMMWARASQHNANRAIRTKTAAWPVWIKAASGLFHIDLPSPTRRIEDPANSEPKLRTLEPMLVSGAAGVISFIINLALYAEGSQPSTLEVMLSIAAPAGSFAAGMLNGSFAHGEAAVSQWLADKKERRANRPTRKARPKSAGPVAEPVQAMAVSAGPMASSGNGHNEVTETMAAHWLAIQERLAAELSNGRDNPAFGRADVENWLGVEKSQARNILRAARDHQVFTPVKNHKYIVRN